MSAAHDETRAGRRRAWHLARIAIVVTVSGGQQPTSSSPAVAAEAAVSGRFVDPKEL